MKRIAIYSRKSIETNVGNSVGNQISMIKDYFKNEDNEFFIFEDEGFSGGNTNRPAFKKMMQDIKRGKFDTIAVYKIDRIARNIVDFVNIYDSLQKSNVQLVSITEGFDASTPYGKLVMMILATFAEMERDNISQRVKDNKVENCKAGKWAGGVAPFGYDVVKVAENGKIVSYLAPNKDISLVPLVYSYYLKSESIHQTQKYVYNEFGIKWAMSTVSYILKSPIYCKSDSRIIDYLRLHGNTVYGEPNGCGIITYNSRPRKKGVKLTRGDDLFFAVSKHEAIIDSNLWIKTQELILKRTQAPRPKRSSISYLTGLLRCGSCGSPLTVNYNHQNKDGTRNYYYVCTGKRNYGASYCNCKQIKTYILDDYVLKKLERFEFTSNSNTVDLSKDIAKLEKLISKDNRDLEKLVEKMINFSGKAAEIIENKIKELSKRVEDNQVILWDLKERNEKTQNINSLVTNSVALIKFADHEGKRELISSIVEKIVWDSENDKIDIICK